MSWVRIPSPALSRPRRPAEAGPSRSCFSLAFSAFLALGAPPMTDEPTAAEQPREPGTTTPEGHGHEGEPHVHGPECAHEHGHEHEHSPGRAAEHAKEGTAVATAEEGDEKSEKLHQTVELKD